jgi:hypothetical protein
MATKTKATKGGNYICKVGFYDIRQKTSDRKTKNGTSSETANSEFVIYHGGKFIEGGFNSKTKATEKAKILLGDKINDYRLN